MVARHKRDARHCTSAVRILYFAMKENKDTVTHLARINVARLGGVRQTAKTLPSLIPYFKMDRTQTLCVKNGVPSLGSKPLRLGGSSNFPPSCKQVRKVWPYGFHRLTRSFARWRQPLKPTRRLLRAATSSVLVVFDEQLSYVARSCVPGPNRADWRHFGAHKGSNEATMTKTAPAGAKRD